MHRAKSTIFTLLVFHLWLEPSLSENVKIWLTTPLDKKNLLTPLVDQEWVTDHATAQHSIQVDESIQYQDVDGVGATLSDSSAWLIWNRLDETARKDLMNQLFSKRYGIGLNLVRIPVGNSAFSVSNYTYDDTCCDLGDFTVEHDRAYMIPLLNMTRSINREVKIFALNWSPPAWMKTSESLVGGKLKEAQFSNFATYLTKFVREYTKEGLPIYALIPKNEPLWSAPCCYPSMLMDAEEQSDFITSKLGPALKKYRMNTKIVASAQSWDNLATYGIDVLSDKTTQEFVSGVAVKCYTGSFQDQNSFHQKQPSQDIWLVECTDEVHTNTNDMFANLFQRSMTRDVIGPLRNWARGIMKWNIALDENHGPQNGGCKNCLGMVTISNDGKVTKNSAYYSFGHLGRFLKSGSKRISSTTFSSTVESVAFENKNGEKVLLVFNKLKEWPVPFKVNWGGKSFGYTIPPYSAVTFVWKGQSQPRTAYERIEAESCSESFGVTAQPCQDESGCGDQIASTDPGDYLIYRNVDFGTEGANKVTFRYYSTKSSLIEIRLDSLQGTLVEVMSLGISGDETWDSKSASVSKVQGLHDVYLVFRGAGGSLCRLNWFVFGRNNEEEEPFSVSTTNYYKIIVQPTNFVLDADDTNMKKVGAPIRQWEFYYVDWQKFYFEVYPGSPGCYKIFVKASRLLLEPRDGKHEDLSPIEQRQDRNEESQTWRLVKSKDGYNRIESCTSGKVMQVERFDSEKGAPIHLAEYEEDKDEQKFTIALIETFPAEVNIEEGDHRMKGT